MPRGDYQVSYVLPARLVPAYEEKKLRIELEDILAKLSINAGIVTSRESLVIRDVLPAGDLGLGNNWWLSAALVANTEMTFINVALGNRRHLAFYGVSTEAAAPAISMAYFRIGATGSSTFLLANLEGLYAEQEPVGYFSEPVIYVPNETVFIRLLPRVTNAAGERIKLHALLAEPKGEAVSSNRYF